MRRIRREPVISEVATAEIRAAILEGTLVPGSRIRQEELAARLGVSRAPIRQALLVLEREGLVQIERWRGAIVAPLDPEFITDIYEFRGAVDAYVAGTLAARGEFDPAPLRQIVAEGRGAVHTEDLPRLIELDLRFHTGLYEAVGNRVLVHVMRAQWSHIRRVMAATLTISGYPRQVWDEHAAILEAIARRQVSRARTLASAHTSAARMVLTGNLGSPVSRSETFSRSRLPAAGSHRHLGTGSLSRLRHRQPARQRSLALGRRPGPGPRWRSR